MRTFTLHLAPGIYI